MPVPKYMVELIQECAAKKHYSFAHGIEQLKTDLGPQILVGNGLKPLIYIFQLAFSTLYPKGEIFHIAPVWVAYIEQSKLLSCKSSIIDTKKTNWKLTPELLDSHLSTSCSKPTMLVFNNPTNPTGLIYTDQEVQLLAKVLAKHGTIVLCDHIYAELTHPKYIKQFGRLENYYSNCIVGSSLSKVYGCGGYRFGWLIFPSSASVATLYRQCQALASNIYTCPSTLFQYVASKLLRNPDKIKQHATFQLDMFSTINDRLQRHFVNMKLLPTSTQACWYTLVDFKNYRLELSKQGITTSAELAAKLLKQIGLVTIPGSAFGLAPQDLILRYSFVDIVVEIKSSTYKYDAEHMFAGLLHLARWLKSI